MPVLTNISQLAVCPPDAPQQDAGLINQAALVWRDAKILWVGEESHLPDEYSNESITDCEGGLLIPGLIDCHTHLCFGGWRGDEFELRLKGASYQEIAASGGGIKSTVTATREESTNQLEQKTLERLDSMLKLGVTTVECKSGYGLDTANELKQLEVYRRADSKHAITLVPTFLGAHVVPKEFENNRAAYIHLLKTNLLPTISKDKLAKFCDIFVEDGAFTIEEARDLLTTAQSLGLGLKIHADQLSNGGGALLAAELNATSAEHLEYIDETGISAMAEAGVVAVSLPLASLYLRERYMPARKMIDAGVSVAVASDFNPGSAPSYHLHLALLLACLNQYMSPQEVLMGATTIAAQAIGLKDNIGSVKAGYQADLTLIDAPNLNHWLYHFKDNACVAVVKNGEWVYRRRPC